MKNHPSLPACALLLAILAIACGDTVDPPDGDPQIRDLRALNTSTSPLSFSYEINDPEGDDVRLRFEVCEQQTPSSPTPTACGVPVQAPGGSGTRYVPTLPAGSFVAHLFRWDLNCGRFVGAQRTPTEPSITYVARVWLDGQSSPAATSTPFVIPNFVLSANRDCPQAP